MKRWCAAVIGLCLAAGASDAVALMKGLSTEELTRESDLVVEGTVGEIRSYWSSDGKAILSSATVTVLDVVRGSGAGTSVTVEYEGGEVGEVGMKVSDMEPLRTGENVLLFLTGTTAGGGEGQRRLVGRSQGKYAIGSDRVARKGGFSAVGGGPIDNDVDVETLKAKIRSVR